MSSFAAHSPRAVVLATVLACTSSGSGDGASTSEDTGASTGSGSTSGAGSSGSASVDDTTDASDDATTSATLDMGGGSIADACAPVASAVEPALAHYVRSGASGDGSGSDWTNAHAEVPKDLERGHTYFVAAGEYPDLLLDDAGEAVITIRKATCSDHGTDDGWDAAYCDGVAQFGAVTFVGDAYVFDGVEGGGPGSWESGFGFHVRSGGHNVHFEGPRRDISLSHVDIENNGRYSRKNPGNEHSVYAIGGVANITIACSFLHDVNGVQLLTSGSDSVTLEYDKLARNGPIRFDDGHREAWSAMDDDNVVIRYNIFEDISNTAYIALVNGVGEAESWTIHGNVFWATGTLDDAGVAALIVSRYDDVHQITPIGWTIHGNAFVNIQGSTNIALPNGQDNRVSNNMWFGNVGNTIGIEGAEHDYNWYFGNIRVEDCDPPCNLDADNDEPNQQIGDADPFVDWQSGDFRLVGPTEPGESLSDAFEHDALGTMRGADGTWDRGAYEYAR